MRLVRTFVVAVLATLLLATATAFACTVHALGGGCRHWGRRSRRRSISSSPHGRPSRACVSWRISTRAAGYHGDVWAHSGIAYLSSWHGDDCPGVGRARDRSRRSRPGPAHVATFADAAREPEVKDTWTEKTIVREARTASFRGTLAVTSLQHCKESAFRGFGLYDLTDPRNPKRLALVRTEGVRGSHEIWLENARGRLWVYTAIVRSELLSSPDYDPQAEDGDEARARRLPHLRRHRPAQPGPGRRLGLLERTRHPSERGARHLSRQPRPLGDHRRRRAAGLPVQLGPRHGDPRHRRPHAAALSRADSASRVASRRATPIRPRSPREGAS